MYRQPAFMLNRYMQLFTKWMAGMVHCDFSGAALMAWDEPGDIGFGTVDLHSCKPFTYTDAVEYTREYFEATDLAWHPVLPDLAPHPALPVGT
jgi:hypothetical protein